MAELASLRRINAINWSIALVLDGPVANGSSEKMLAAASAGDSMSWNTGLNLVFVELLLFFNALEPVEAVTLFDFLEGNQLVEGRLADRNDLFEHVPQNAFAERSSRQRALVSPPLFVLQMLDEVGEVEILVSLVDAKVPVLIVLCKLEEEPVVSVRVALEV